MAPDLARLVCRATFLLLAVAAAACEIAAADTRPVGRSLALAASWVGVALALSWFVPTPKPGRKLPPWWAQLALLLFALAPLLTEPVRRSWTGDGYPLELQLVTGFRNLGLGLAACAIYAVCLRSAAVVSLFLMLFSVCMTDHPAVAVLMGVYCAAGGGWLTLLYWAGLKQSFATADGVTVTIERGRDRLPWAALAVFVTLLVAVLGLIAAGPKRVAYALGELMPTSGGTGDYDPFARGGVNDGDDETKGDNPNSTGMTQTDSFLDSPLPSLYDLASDLYGPPKKRKGDEPEQAIVLGSDVKALELKGKRPADNLRPNREFATHRQTPKRSGRPDDARARALFEVAGRTPLHIRATVHERYLGSDWQAVPINYITCLLDQDDLGHWMNARGRKLDEAGAAREEHQLKITAPLGALVPVPPLLERFRIGKVDRADYFAWGADRLLRFAQRSTPDAITIETVCRVPDPALLSAVKLTTGPSSGRPDQFTAPPSALRELARTWAADAPPGWPQVEAVLQRLRHDYTLDRDYRPAADPLTDFLFVSKRGPDYLFATAATLLLREFGCGTRFVSGFYAAPDAYDAKTRHTPVRWGDLHCWCEVVAANGDWLVVEATPGYDVLTPTPSIFRRALAALAAVGRWLAAHPWLLALVLFVVGFTLWRRRELLDAAAVARWRLLPGDWRREVAGAVRILERRGRWAGQARPASATVRRWLDTARPELNEVAALAEWAAYAPNDPPMGGNVVRVTCARALTDWTWKRWRAGVAR